MSVDNKVPKTLPSRNAAQGEPREPGALPRVAFIGLGRVGSRIAWRLAEAGVELAVYDADQSAMDRFGATRIRRSRSPEAVVVDCDLLITALPNGAVVSEVVRAAMPAAGTLVIDTSSGDPEDAKALGARLAERDVALIDAAVSGGIERAAAGHLLILAGGAAHDLERARPVLDLFAERVIHCGPLGAGLAMRALNSLLSAVSYAATIEALQMGKRYALDPKLMLDVFNTAGGGNHATAHEIAPYVLTGRFDSGRAIDHLVKDMSAALKIASATKTDVPLSRLAAEIWRYAETGLEPGADRTALARWYEHRTGTRLRS